MPISIAYSALPNLWSEREGNLIIFRKQLFQHLCRLSGKRRRRFANLRYNAKELSVFICVYQWLKIHPHSRQSETLNVTEYESQPAIS
ncbi:hypothetical protein [Microcoleus sp. FACHB-672]|uniref:hypothetical protein n=1 Tax=Microcoleus sp. FACHB-672 TaxID=2692825 RepID=UPI00168921DE|nr:hypothetical protein [Microcoleus sp. FACHB-672]MBD2043645.1 hypothetical protein [Microcoleus sp. FACHB-672]